MKGNNNDDDMSVGTTPDARRYSESAKECVEAQAGNPAHPGAADREIPATNQIAPPEPSGSVERLCLILRDEFGNGVPKSMTTKAASLLAQQADQIETLKEALADKWHLLDLADNAVAQSRQRADQAEATITTLEAEIAQLKADREVLSKAVNGIITIDRASWQPIESAPKDHSRFLAFIPGSRLPVQEIQWLQSYEEDVVGYWSTPYGPAGRGYTILIDAPTHWMPLPSPPQVTQESDHDR